MKARKEKIATDHRDFSRVNEMLRSREAGVLKWSLWARMVFLAVFVTFCLLHLTRLISPGIVSDNDAGAMGSLIVVSVATVVIFCGLVITKRTRHLFAVGMGAVVVDLLLMALLPLVWLKTVSTPDGSPAFLMKTELFTISVIAVVVNSMALRPLYPAIMAAGMIVIHLVIMQVVLGDPHVVRTSEFTEHFYTSAVNPGIFVIRVITLALIGTFLSFLAWAARRNIRDGVELEVSNFEMRERQAQRIHEGKMAALSGLIAGVAHEVNTPLGVAQSSVDSLERCASRLADETATTSSGSKVARILQFMRGSSNLTRKALERITNLVASLKEFARLDEAEIQRADLRTGLDTTLSLIESNTKGQTEVVREYGEIPEIESRPKELNQVFMTLIVNAFEATSGEGTLRISTAANDDRITIEVADSGPGLPDDKVANLFEIGFHATKGRISMGLINVS